MGRIIACLALLVGFALAGCGNDGSADAVAPSAEPTAGTWRTWILRSPEEVRVPPPPSPGSAAAGRDAKALADRTAGRTAAERDAIRRWSTDPVVKPWLEQAMTLVSRRPKDPPAASRGYALVGVAMYDAVVAAWHWKYAYKRAAPGESNAADLSYPSEHAAIAGAASRVIAYAFPDFPAARLDRDAEDAARTQVLAGAARPSDAQAGLELGRAVADRVIARARRDGSTRKWDGRRPRGKGYWEPPPGSAARPVQPLAGTWRTWALRSGDELRPGPPPRYGSPEFLEEARELVRIRENLTLEQKRIAKFWEGGEGTELPPGIWVKVMLAELRGSGVSTPRAARLFALLTVAMADAGVASWDAKYAYWNPRPENAIVDLIDPNWKPYLQTPLFPAYVSGHATYSTAAAEVLAHLYPQRAELWRERGAEAGLSRLYGGIHYRSDNVVGARMGREIGRRVVEIARQDGAKG